MRVNANILFFLFVAVFCFLFLLYKTRGEEAYGLLKSLIKEQIRGLDTHPNTTTPSDTFLIPDDKTLDGMSKLQLLQLYQKYVNTLQALCKNVIRIGSMNDGGKEICVDEQYKPKAPCLIYSFGINNQWDFDNMAAEVFGCEIHCFDPSMRKETSQVSKNVWFYNIGIGGTNKVDRRKWDIRTLQKIKEDLKHQNRTIDVLKMDVEGDEWHAIPAMLDSGVIHSVKQIAIELHFGNDKTQLAILRQLYEAGFRIVMRDRNILNLYVHPAYKQKITNLYELTLLRWKE